MKKKSVHVWLGTLTGLFAWVYVGFLMFSNFFVKIDSPLFRKMSGLIYSTNMIFYHLYTLLFVLSLVFWAYSIENKCKRGWVGIVLVTAGGVIFYLSMVAYRTAHDPYALGHSNVGFY